MTRLTLEEMRAAYRKGVARSGAARSRSGKHRFGWTPDPAEQRMVDGYSAVAEASVAKALGRVWTSDGLVPDGPDDGDVEGGISVRWTKRTDGCLIIHEDEPPELCAVLVVGTPPDHRIVGWIAVVDAAIVGEWRTDVRHPAFFVAQERLQPLEDLLVAAPGVEPGCGRL